MGALFSTNNMTAETKTVLNTILKGMFSRADLVDLYSMADPSKCSKYIVATESALQKVFARVNLYPGKKDGELFFQKLEGIEKANPNREEQAKYCRELSFFFIRIFQIYGAIALTIIDSDLPSIDPIEEIRDRGDIGKRVVFYDRKAGVAGLPRADNRPFSFRLFGGGLNGSYALGADVYGRVLSQYLNSPSDPASTNDITMDRYSEIRILQASLYDNVGAARTVKQGIQSIPIMYITSRNGEEVVINSTLFLSEGPSRLTMELRDTTIPGGKKLDRAEKFLTKVGDTYRDGAKQLPEVLHDLLETVYNRIEPPAFHAGQFLYDRRIIASMEGHPTIQSTDIIIDNAKDSGEELDVVFRAAKTIESRQRTIRIYTSIRIEKKENRGKGQEYDVLVNYNDIRVDPEELEEYVDVEETGDRWKGRRSTFSTGADDKGTPRNDKGDSIPQYLQGVFRRLIRDRAGERGVRDGIRYKADGTPIPHDSETISDSLRIKWLWEGLRKNPPVKAHCVARAMQLLNLRALRDGDTTGAFTSVCKTKFAYVKDNSLPEPGKAITSELGVKALSVLFVKLMEGNMRIDPNDGKFNNFKRRFMMYFQRLEDEPTSIPGEMSDIKDLMLPGCAGKDAAIPLKSGMASTLRGYTNTLISRQSQHVTDSMNIIFMLFNERAVRQGQYELSEYVLQGGMEAVNDIGERARIMLSEYYGACEEVYKNALLELHRTKTIYPQERNVTRRA